jgi:CelD/BcsL family acetyltransferase involved in cellulose biosynthesis
MPDHSRYEDLSSTLYVNDVPAWVPAELVSLYGSMYATMEYFRIYDAASGMSTCILDDPRHVVVFTVTGGEATVLNKVFEIDPESADRLCATVFRAFPAVDRIRLEVMFEPALMRHPVRIVHDGEDNVVWLPSDVDEYRARLGPVTRKKLGQRWRKLQKAHPDARVRTLDGSSIEEELVHRAVELNRRRMTSLGVVSGFDGANEERLEAMTRRFGRANVLEVDDEVAAVVICQEIGSHTLAQIAVFDERYERYSPGLTVCYEAICESIRRGKTAFHFSWGREPYKRQLGAVILPAHTLSVYRSRAARALALSEATRLQLKRVRRGVRRLLRPGVRTTLRRWRDATPVSAAARRAESLGPAAPRDPVVHGDLGCTVFLDSVPSWAQRELPDLYRSSFSVVEYFRIYDGVTRFSACIMEQPRHIVLFSHEGASATVLNQLFDIDPGSFARVCAAIFRTLPDVARIRFNGSRLDPSSLALPTRVVARSEDVVMDLPAAYDAYFASLGPASRKNLRKHSRRLAASHPGLTTRVYEREDIPKAKVNAIVELNRRRMASKGDTSMITAEDERRLTDFGRYHGLCVTFELDGKVIAGTLGTLVGGEYYGDVQTFDPDYHKFRLGTLCMLQTIRECIARGGARYHLLWGLDEYKSQLGGEPQWLCAFEAYRSVLARTAHVDDVLRATAWRWRRRPWAARALSLAGRLSRPQA